MAERSTAPQVVHTILGKVAAHDELLDATPAESLVGLQGSLAGLACRPARYGGSEIGTDEFVSQVCELAALDGSLGWLAAMFNAAARDVATLPDDVARAVWGSDRDAVVTTGHQGSGAVNPAQRLTGKWEAVIGAEYADWLVLPVKNTAARRVLVPREAAHIEPISDPSGLSAAGVCDVTIADFAIDRSHAFMGDPRATAIAMAGAAAAVTGSAGGVWRHHVDQMRARLATSYSSDELANAAPAQVARAASDIDAAELQITDTLRRSHTAATETWAYQQAVARARAAADLLLGNSRHALDLTDPATRRWRDVHAGCRLAATLLNEAAHA
jgi:3-hydroxy-9,10-secoandrosta-1,3,5(10)-triene-9,17-dione monooxygenase